MEKNLEQLYESIFREETIEMNRAYAEFMGGTRDKLFTLEYLAGLYQLMQAFNNGGKLTKQIKSQYEAGYKLGFSIYETLKSVPELILTYQKELEIKRTKLKPKPVKYIYKWKKTKLGIPIWINKIGICVIDDGEVVGPFYGLSDLSDITKKLAKINAHDHFVEFLRAKCIEFGVSNITFGSIGAKMKIIPQQLCNHLEIGDLYNFFSLIKSIFATNPYFLTKSESDYHNIIHIILTMTGFEVLSEQPTNIGRIDSVIETDKIIYIMEFKVDSDLGLQQIKKKKYFERYALKGKKIVIVGVNISSKEKNIENWEQEEIPIA